VRLNLSIYKLFIKLHYPFAIGHWNSITVKLNRYSQKSFEDFFPKLDAEQEKKFKTETKKTLAAGRDPEPDFPIKPE
jgi:hypothetical protein